MDVDSIITLLQQHWLELLIFFAIVIILKNLRWIIIAGLVLIALMYFGYLDSIKELILSYFNSFNSHGIPFEFLQNLTSNTTIQHLPLTPRGYVPLPRG